MKLRNLILMALFIAISVLGANIRIAGSIAFDSMAGFLAALILGPAYGAIIGAVGHFLSAAYSGFPLSLPVHLIIMVDMALTMFIFGILYKAFWKKNSRLAIITASAAGVIINGPLSLLMLIPICGVGILGMMPILSLAAFSNVLIADLVYKFLPESIKLWKSERLGI